MSKHNNNNRQRGYVNVAQIKDEIIIFIFTALIAGVASYLNRTITEKSQFSFYRFLAHVLASITASWIAYNSIKALGITNEYISTCAIGLAGWAGPTAMDFLAYVARIKILSHFGFTKHADREQYYTPPPPVATQPYSPQNAPQTTIPQQVTPTYAPQAHTVPMSVPTQPGTPQGTPQATPPAAEVVAGSAREERLARKQAAMAAQENAGNTLK